MGRSISSFLLVRSTFCCLCHSNQGRQFSSHVHHQRSSRCLPSCRYQACLPSSSFSQQIRQDTDLFWRRKHPFRMLTRRLTAILLRLPRLQAVLHSTLSIRMVLRLRQQARCEMGLSTVRRMVDGKTPAPALVMSVPVHLPMEASTSH